MRVADIAERVVALHDALIEQYAGHTQDEQAITDFIDTLKQYTSSVALAASQSIAEMLGIESDIRMLELTERQYRRLEESGTLSDYIDGREKLDD